MRRLHEDKVYKGLLISLCVEVVIFAMLIVASFLADKTYVLVDGDNTISLPFGHYFVTCCYDSEKTDDTVNYLYIQNNDKTTQGIPQTDNYLRDDQNSYTGEFWIYSIKKISISA